MNKPTTCPHCGQPIPESRLGLPWTPIKRRIIDIIRAAGQDGIERSDLKAMFPEMSPKTLNAHIWQINDRLEDVGYRITGRTHAKLVKRKNL